MDGANVIASGSSRALERLSLALDWLAAWQPKLPVRIFVDSTTFARCRPDARNWLCAAQATAARTPTVELCPEGTEADIPLLQFAQREQALVLSNDRFFDHASLRAGVLTLQFALERSSFLPAAEATWFRLVGQAIRVPIDQIAFSV
jgi:hypothetical protein